MRQKIIYENAADEKDYIFFRKIKNNKITPHFHHNLELMFVASGKERVVINGEERVLSKGGLGISSNYAVHYYEPVGESEVYILLIGGKYVTRFYGDNGQNFVHFVDCSPRFDRIAALLEQSLQEFDGYNDLMKTAAIDFLLGYLVLHFDIVSDKKPHNTDMIQILTYVNANYREPLTAENTAKIFGYTKTYFSALFNRYTGRHFRTHLNQLRLEAAEHMHEEDSIPVTKAALSVGFDSLNTYYRAKKHQNRTF